LGLPVVAAGIPGNVGKLSDDHPGYYETGDESALAELLCRTETEDAFYETLRSASGRRFGAW